MANLKKKKSNTDEAKASLTGYIGKYFRYDEFLAEEKKEQAAKKKLKKKKRSRKNHE